MTRPAPMADGTLAALAKRVEAEPVERRLWVDAFHALRPGFHGPGVFTYAVEWQCFLAFLDVGVYLDAADMLRPEGWLPFYLEQYPKDAAVERLQGLVRFGLAKGTLLAAGEAHSPHAEARARLVAALRARDTDGGR